MLLIHAVLISHRKKNIRKCLEILENIRKKNVLEILEKNIRNVEFSKHQDGNGLMNDNTIFSNIFFLSMMQFFKRNNVLNHCLFSTIIDFCFNKSYNDISLPRIDYNNANFYLIIKPLSTSNFATLFSL